MIAGLSLMHGTPSFLLGAEQDDTPEHSDRSRRLHGSLRVGSDATPFDAPKTFNLRPTLEDLAEEQVVTVEINGWPAAKLVCSPSALAELGVGWSFSRGFLHNVDQIGSVTTCHDRVSVMLHCPGPRESVWNGVESSGFDTTLLADLAVAPSEQDVETGGDGSETVCQFDRSQFISIVERLFTRMRGDGIGIDDGVHYAAVTDGDQLSAIARDICRQNAVDKIIGWAINRRLDCRSLILCVSGRITADIAAKAARARFPIVVTRSVPSSDAVDIAHRGGITLVGHVLDPQRAIYAHPWRLLTHEVELGEL